MMACCNCIRLFQNQTCPCGAGTDPICNTAQARADYDCTACGGAVVGALNVVSEAVCVDVVDVQLVKTVNPTCVLRGEPVIYTIAIRNCSTIPVTGLTVTDETLAQYFDVGTIRVNGVITAGDPEAGIPVPGILAGATAVVTIEATPTAEAPAVVENTAFAAYAFETTCGGTATATAVSNATELQVANPELTVIKEADRCFVTLAEPTLTYTVTLTNTGTCPLDNVLTVDEIPERLSYVAGTTIINGDDPVDLDPAAGIDLGSLAVNQSATVQYDAVLICAVE